MINFKNRAYSFKPFAGCPDSFVIDKANPSNTFSPGMFYIGFFSLCLPSCAFCDGNYTYSAHVSGTADLNRCLLNPSTPTTGTTSILISDSQVIRPFYALCFFIWMIVTYVK